jgi:hypothetical protein
MSRTRGQPLTDAACAEAISVPRAIAARIGH